MNTWEWHAAMEMLLNPATGTCFGPSWVRSRGRQLYSWTDLTGSRYHCIAWSEL